MAAETALKPGAVIGILGGGQLGRMIALAAARLGLKSHIFCPDPHSPAFDVTSLSTCAAYEDEAALARFAESVEIVTYEFENVPEATAAFLQARVPVRPGPRSLAICQDRLAEKDFLTGIGIETAPYRAVDSLEDLVAALDTLGTPSVLKTRRFGYDGKGQAMIRDKADAANAWDTIGKAPAILEGFVPFSEECSVLVARSTDGEMAVYDIALNRHENHILKFTTVPAPIAEATAEAAREIGRKAADALDHVGMLAVELFLVSDNNGERLIANEMAPRVHNSGHWTEDACLVSQFEQHARAVAGWPLGNTDRLADVEMENLIGDDADRWPALLAEVDAHIHLYGKTETRPGRKMGHVNRLQRRGSPA